MPTVAIRMVLLVPTLWVATPGLAQAAGDKAGVVDPAPPAPPAPAATAASDTAGLAQQVANPIANLISLPFQDNIDFGLGPKHDGVRSTLNIQPVIPVSISDDYNLISRTILPVIYQNAEVSGRKKFGIGDIVQSLFFSPKSPTREGVVWGVGPVLLLPTATDPVLGSGKWGAGPSAVVLKQSHGFTYGALFNHIWSVAGKRNRSDVSQTLIQPFLNYTWPSTVAVGLSSEATYNWKTEHWLVPINLALSKIVRLGKQPASIQAGVRYFPERPEGAPRWGARLSLTLLFPKRRAKF